MEPGQEPPLHKSRRPTLFSGWMDRAHPSSGNSERLQYAISAYQQSKALKQAIEPICFRFFSASLFYHRVELVAGRSADAEGMLVKNARSPPSLFVLFFFLSCRAMTVTVPGARASVNSKWRGRGRLRSPL